MLLRFTVRARPYSTNNLYATSLSGRRFKRSEIDGYRTLILNAALDAADACGWDLAYAGHARVTIVDWRASKRGLDWDNIPKAICDSLVPQVIRDDRFVWDGRVIIARDAKDPRLVVTVVAVSEAEILKSALANSLDPHDEKGAA